MSLLSDSCVDNPSLPEIPNSLRLNGTSSYLSRTVTATGNRQTFCISWWVKRSEIGVLSYQFGAYFTNNQYIAFSADDTLSLMSGGIGTFFISDAKFDDPTAWYHFVFAVDTTQATGNRFKFWCNGVYLTGAYTASGLNALWAWNAIQATYPNLIGDSTTLHNYPNQYMSNICHIDGYPTGINNANWDATNFGELFAYTDYNGQWRSKSKTELTTLINAGGTNSYFLSFDNGASTTTLGYDASSKGNNWTLTSMVRDGSVNDCWTYDTPTNNFCTLNPVDSFMSGTLGTLTTGALTISAGGARASTIWVNDTSGKVYWEVNLPTIVANFPTISIYEAISPASWNSTNIFSWYTTDGQLNYNGGYVDLTSSFVLANGDTAMIALDCATGKLWLGKNGIWLKSGSPSTGANPAYTFASPSTPKKVGSYANGYVANFNFGQLPVTGGSFYADANGYFKHAPPTGFKALCTKNIDSAQGLITSGTFTGNAAADGPMVFTNGTPTSLTIDGNAVTWGTHADKLANGFKLRTASAPYNDSASNAFSVTVSGNKFKYASAQTN